MAEKFPSPHESAESFQELPAHQAEALRHAIDHVTRKEEVVEIDAQKPVKHQMIQRMLLLQELKEKIDAARNKDRLA